MVEFLERRENGVECSIHFDGASVGGYLLDGHFECTLISCVMAGTFDGRHYTVILDSIQAAIETIFSDDAAGAVGVEVSIFQDTRYVLQVMWRLLGTVAVFHFRHTWPENCNALSYLRYCACICRLQYRSSSCVVCAG